MEGLEIWVVGGDERQRLLAGLLAEKGHRVHTLALGEGSGRETAGLGRADCVLFPLPVSREKGRLFAPLAGEEVALDTVLDAMRPGQLALGGQVGAETARAFQARGLRWRDYFAREELAVANAVPTAEGAIQLALERLPVTLHGSRALVLGYGRIGRMLALRLRGLGSEVTAAARREEQLAWARADGCAALHLDALAGTLGRFDVIFNTVPAVLLDGELLGGVKPGCPVIDLASEPGGVDREAARTLGVETVWARGLPGKTAPLTAARAIEQTVYHILEEVPT